jgi:hypothetical protein
MASHNDNAREFNCVSDSLRFLHGLSLDESSFRFRGQANADWTLQPSVYRFSGFKRYQTVNYESHVLAAKPPPSPPLTHTDFQLEWLMVCQHYGVPTRLLDWSNDILVAMYFACDSDSERDSDGALYICDQRGYPKFSAYNKHAMETQELAFVSTSVVNPRMRTQSGCFMMWGHAPLGDESKESYDLWQYHESHDTPRYIEKIRIPSNTKRSILEELKKVYGITTDTLYLKDGYLESEFGPRFQSLKQEARLKTLYMTDADRLSRDEEKVARSFFRIDCRNMIGECVSITRML